MQAAWLGETLASFGGQNREFVASGASTRTIKTGKGRLCRISITAAGTASFTVFDNTAGSGAVLFTSPASTAVGTVFDINLPAETGITVVNVASGPAFAVSFN
jgi:hypothetical protein